MLHCVIWGESILPRPRSMCWLYKCTLSVRRVKKHESWGVLSVIVRRVCSVECWVWRLIVAADWDWGAALVTNTMYYLHYLHYLLSTMLLCAAGQRSADKPNCISSNSVFALDFINQALNLIFRIISSHCIRYLLNSGLEMGPGC